MKAWTLDQLKGIEGLQLREVPDPQPAAGEVVLEVIYAALNPADRYLAEGQYPAKPTFPHILGRDGIGRVTAVGNGVKDINIGEQHTILRGDAGVNRAGTFAEKVAIPVENLVKAPAGWTPQQASCAALVYITSFQAITQWNDLPKQAAVLVTGASGGVGVASTQLAGAMGHTVIGLSRSEEKQRKLIDLGAAAVFDPKDGEWRKKLKGFLAGRKIDLAIDNIGGKLFSELLDTLGDQGRVSCVGRLAGPVPEFNTASLFFRRIKVGGVAIASYSNSESRAAWDAVLEILKRRGAAPLIDRVFGFDALPKAFERLADGPMGKVLLEVSGTP